MEVKSGFDFLPTMSEKEKIDKWRASCANKKPVITEASDLKTPKHYLHEQGWKQESIGEGCKTFKNEALKDKPVIESNQTSAALQKLAVLQGMKPIKFSGNPSD